MTSNSFDGAFIQEFKPFKNNSQETSIGSDEAGQITFQNDTQTLALEGRIEFKKDADGAMHARELAAMLLRIAEACEPGCTANDVIQVNDTPAPAVPAAPVARTPKKPYDLSKG